MKQYLKNITYALWALGAIVLVQFVFILTLSGRLDKQFEEINKKQNEIERLTRGTYGTSVTINRKLGDFDDNPRYNMGTLKWEIDQIQSDMRQVKNNQFMFR